MKYGHLISTLLFACTTFCYAQQVQTYAAPSAHEVTELPNTQGKKIKNVVFMIGDGMGLEHIAAAQVANGGKLNILQLPVAGLIKTDSASHLVTDSAAAGTALACGVKTNNGTLGLTPTGEKLESLAVEARRAGMSTGLVVTKAITDATPAAFYAHVKSRNQTADIAADLVKSNFDIIVGGGEGDFTPEQREQLAKKTHTLKWLAQKHCNPPKERGEIVLDALRLSLANHKKNNGNKPLFLMIEGSHIDSGGHERSLERVIDETLEFDRCVGIILEWMKDNPDTLLIITADHATGGLVMQNGSRSKRTVQASFSTDQHNGSLIPVFALGPGADNFSGYYENTGIKERLMRLKFNKKN